MTTDPFVTLLDIENNCKAYAVNIPRQIATERDWLGIGFRSSDYNFVCAMEEVSEILRWPAMTNVPGSQPWFKGIANLRGHILPVTDLQGFISGTPHEETVSSRVLLVNYESAYYGFAVGQVLGIERFFAEEVKPAVNLNNISHYMPYVKGVFERDYKPWAILNFGVIIQTAEFYHILTSKTEAA